MGAIGVAREAAAPAVEDEQMAEKGPVVLRDEFHEVGLDLYRVVLTAEVESEGEAGNVSIDDDADVFAEGIAEDDVGGFASHAAEGGEFFHGIGNAAAVPFDDRLATGFDAFGFVPKKAGGLDGFLEFGRGGAGVVCGGGVFGEERRGDLIDAFVGALGGKNGGDEELERIGMVQFTMGVRVGCAEFADDPQGAILF